MSAGATVAGGGSARTGGADGRRRSRPRSYRRFDPHTSLDLARRLTDAERCSLLDLLHHLRAVDARLQTIAARHYEII